MSIMLHVGIVLFLLWGISCYGWTHPSAYFVSLVYLFLVHERYVMKLRKKLQYEESKQANRKRVLSDSETVRWLNHAVEKIWPICMEEITSQKILLPIIPWFLDKYKPWTAKKAEVQHLYMGRNPPVFTEVRVLRQCPGDDHLALEMGLRFVTADDMLAVLAVKMRRRLGFGMRTKLHITGMQVEGKVLIGIKFLRRWPFIGRLRVCFAEPPYFQMTVKPIFTRGVDVTVLPGIAGWLDKLLSMAFEQTLVQPNMLVVDMEKFASPSQETWFSVDEKKPVAFAKLEVIEASDMKPSDMNGLADPYVKGQLGPYGFRTKVQRKTLSPKWLEEFEIPIITWESPNLLAIDVRDKDHFVDDALGKCTICINDMRDGERHDMWLPLEGVKIGRLHLALTIREQKEEAMEGEEARGVHESCAIDDEDATNRSSLSSLALEVSQKVSDNLEPINVEGQQATGIWIHQPGTEVSQTWEPRKAKTRQVGYTQHSNKSLGDSLGSSIASGAQPDDDDSSSSTDEAAPNGKKRNRVRRGLHRITAALRGSTKEDSSHPGGNNEEAAVQSPYANIRAANQKEGGVKFVVDDSLSSKIPKQANSSPDSTSSPKKHPGGKREKTKRILKQMGKSARNLKHVLSRKGSRASREGGGSELAVDDAESDTSDDDDDEDDDDDNEEAQHAVGQPQQQPDIVCNPISASHGSDEDADNENDKNKEKSHETRAIEDVARSEERNMGNGKGETRAIEDVARSEERNVGNGEGAETNVVMLEGSR